MAKRWFVRITINECGEQLAFHIEVMRYSIYERSYGRLQRGLGCRRKSPCASYFSQALAILLHVVGMLELTPSVGRFTYSVVDGYNDTSTSTPACSMCFIES